MSDSVPSNPEQNRTAVGMEIVSMPFRSSWDQQLLFLGVLPRSSLEVARADTKAESPVDLVRLRRGVG